MLDDKDSHVLFWYAIFGKENTYSRPEFVSKRVWLPLILHLYRTPCMTLKIKYI